MLKPIDFKVDDFISSGNPFYTVLAAEALSGAELVDNLILLEFIDAYSLRDVLSSKYGIDFAWLQMDPTPAEMRDIADKHGVMVARARELTVYVPLGATVDDAALQIDIPDYKFVIKHIADCNYRILKKRLTTCTLTKDVANLRPLLIFRRIILDCIARAGTDVHFESCYDLEKKPKHTIRYRINRELQDSKFVLDKEMMTRVLQQLVSKLAPASASDLDSASGVTTEVRDLFKDGSCDLRITAMRVDAGFYAVIAIQTTKTTMLNVDQLGFPPKDVATLRNLAQRRTGLTLVTGEMRSGKNTTIFAMLNEIVDEPIRIIEYSNPIENHMPFPQCNYRGDYDLLKNYLRMAKKQDIDIAVLNEIPNAEVAFAVRDLVNSAIGVITTTHITRIWHLPNKLHEFFGKDYKTILSQLNACVNHKMFKRWSSPSMQKRILQKEHGPFELFCYQYGVRQYFVPEDPMQVSWRIQPLAEIIVFDDAMKSALLNFDEISKAEMMIQNQIRQKGGMLEHKVAEYINNGIMPLDTMKCFF